MFCCALDLYHLSTSTSSFIREQATRRPVVQVSCRWWEQTGIDLKGAQEKAAAAAAEIETEADSESEDDPDGAAGGR